MKQHGRSDGDDVSAMVVGDDFSGGFEVVDLFLFSFFGGCPKVLTLYFATRI